MELSGSTAEGKGTVDRDDGYAEATGGHWGGAIRPSEVTVDDGENRRLGERAVIFSNEPQKLTGIVDKENACTKALLCCVVLLTLQKLRPPAGCDGGSAMIGTSDGQHDTTSLAGLLKLVLSVRRWK